MRGIIYQNPLLYHTAMHIIYGPHFKKRYELVAANIEKDWTVLDLCCGDCYITNFLDKSVKYEGRDFNNIFLEKARENGLKVSFCDLRKGLDELGHFDCVLMMGSLHQFIPREDIILNEMKNIALKRIIISEPCRNIVSSKNALVSFAAKVISNPGNESTAEIKRFNRNDLLALFNQHHVNSIIDVGKDLIGIFNI